MDKKASIAIAYAAKRRSGPRAPIVPQAEAPSAEQSIVAAIAAKRAPKPELLDMTDELIMGDLSDDELVEPVIEEESTGNSLADKIRARMAKR